MKKELNYLFIILAIFTTTIISLFILLKKYSFLTFEHFVDICRQASSNLLASGLHHIGFGLSTLAFFSILVFITKAIFSYIKTKRRLDILLENKASKYSEKLIKVLNESKIAVEKVLVVNSKKDIAVTINWSNPQIILSTGLIKKLSTQELGSVALHEYYHLRNKHPLILLLSEIITSSLFFIPILKDINRKLRSALENEADQFTSNVQKGSTSLELALAKVEVENRFPVFPSFSKRNEYKLESKNVFLSILVVLMGIALYILPTRIHASLDISEFNSLNCSNQLCSVHCMGESVSKEMAVSTSTQNKIIMSSYKTSF